MAGVREIVNEVHETNLVGIKAALGRVATSTRTALAFQDLRARLNKEIGTGTADRSTGGTGTTIVFVSNVDPRKLDAARSRALPLLPGSAQNSQETA